MSRVCWKGTVGCTVTEQRPHVCAADSSRGFSDPIAVMGRLEQIEQDLAERQNRLEDAALQWFREKRNREHERAKAWIAAEASTNGERAVIADRETALIGCEAEARYEALKAVCRVLETRASIGQSILRAQARG